jgi:hypothetical protein
MPWTADLSGKLVPLGPDMSLPLQISGDRFDVLPAGGVDVLHGAAIHAYASDKGFCFTLANGDDRPKPLSRRRTINSIPRVKIVEEALWDRDGATHQLRALRIGRGHLREEFS